MSTLLKHLLQNTNTEQVAIDLSYQRIYPLSCYSRVLLANRSVFKRHSMYHPNNTHQSDPLLKHYLQELQPHSARSIPKCNMIDPQARIEKMLPRNPRELFLGNAL
ncbi:unnamed protein product [Brugia timori]|uniref:Ovule protein n=1 Tax=Brugia timori TaxID=42155 RepID=A0A0R3QFP3_9BILA|nr:unnamed protein product [Brugia timori]